MVRLKDSKNQAKNNKAKQFQFHNGSIKSRQISAILLYQILINIARKKCKNVDNLIFDRQPPVMQNLWGIDDRRWLLGLRLF